MFVRAALVLLALIPGPALMGSAEAQPVPSGLPAVAAQVTTLQIQNSALQDQVTALQSSNSALQASLTACCARTSIYLSVRDPVSWDYANRDGGVE
jgi:hypothetical protein